MPKHRSLNPQRSSSNHLKRVTSGSAQLIRDAAALLDEELASGIVAAKKMQQRFHKDRRIDAESLKSALQKFQTQAHEITALAEQQVAEFRSNEDAALAKRLFQSVHNVVDLAAAFVNDMAEIADQLAEANVRRKANRHGKRRG